MLNPPKAEKRPITAIHHGRPRVDDYGWLRADNWQEVMHDPTRLPADIRAYLEAENAYTDGVMADTEKLQEQLFAEMKGRIEQNDATVPTPDGPFAYAVRFVEGAQYPRMVRMLRDGSGEQTLIDGQALAEGRDYFRLGGASHSPDHALLGYATDFAGSERYDIRFRQIDSGADLPDIISGTAGGLVWAEDGPSVLYTLLDEQHRPSKVMRHVLGTDPAEDTLVFADPEPRYFLGTGKTRSHRFLLIQSYDHETSEVHYLPADDPGAEPKLLAPRRPEERYSVDHVDDHFVILTNADGAEDFKIVTAAVDAPGRENWRDLVPHKPGRLIIAYEVFKDFLVWLEREDGLPRIVIRRWDTAEEHAIAFDEEAYSLGIIPGYEFDSPTLRFTYSSMTTPASVYDYDMSARTRVLRKIDRIPSGHDPDEYVTRRVHAVAPDGEEVPISLLYRKDTPLDGTAPLLLYGYGAYGVSTPAAFASTRLSLVDRGWVYAIAHTRGGQEKGYRWYADARREKKVNTFTDYLAAAEYLAASRYTAKGRIVGWGGSAGGLLMGVAANRGPELFAGIIAEVPFVDVLSTMLDETLPLTPPEWPEWGNPAESPAAFDIIAAYSPYDNITRQAYPAILAVGGLSDSRVTYWEPAKWVARLREMNTGTRPILLWTHMVAGHGGPSGRFDSLVETAFATAFALKAVGMVPAEEPAPA